MKNYFLSLLALTFVTTSLSAQDNIPTSEGTITIHPITHGTLAIQFNNKTMYIDPYGGSEKFKNLPNADIILITDIHGDHLNQKTLDGLDTKKTQFIVPQAVADKLPEAYKPKLTILNNDQSVHRLDFYITATPMYNLPETEDSRHPKGRGNGYIINVAGKNMYISGDTEDIPEMRNLRDIDIAFICMNLPYTMDINQAADAVLEFQPKIVYPFHFRGKPDFSDVEKFKEIVNSKNNQIEVRLRDWYQK
ncbi:MBL fold metallo-hydrolase [Urechidicola vernalis]|uniref:MBL fold metallo-hydrolase n=1 Tax=Urechidicola vernalis TaxID=3075600 RepID=A0ABU2Y6A8_9FLAO|nr:MBL fold metallo-hydrolase [Urechidicola sp. P050]MDT0553305.1 MBL fold metallo-hydrolase [Urechidicola sp. P050]